MAFHSSPRHRFLLQALFGVALVAVLLGWVDFDALRSALLQSDPWLTWWGLCFFCLMVLVDAWRLEHAFRHYDLDYMTCLQIQCAGFFLSSFTPGMAGAEALKVLVAHRIRPGVVAPLTLALMLRVLGLVTMLGLLVAYTIAYPERILRITQRLGWNASLPSGTAWGVLVVAALLTAVTARWAWRRYGDRLRRMTLNAYRAVGSLGTRTLTILLIQSFLMVAAGASSLYFLASATGADTRIPDMLLVLVLLTFGSLLPATPGGLGLREGAIAAGLVAFGSAAPRAIAAGFLHRGCFWFVALVGGLFLLFWRDWTGQRAR